MELLTFSVPEVRFDFPDPTTTITSAMYSLNGATATALAVTPHVGYATAKLPYQQNDGQVTVVWSFTVPGGSYTRTMYYDVVTPLLSAQQVRDIIGDDASDDEVMAAEGSARYIIQSYTGQTFGRYAGPISVTGAGANFLRLPRRLITLNSINSDTVSAQWVVIRGDGWFMKSKVIGTPTIRSDFDGWHQLPQTGVITAPPRWARPLAEFLTNAEFVIDGVWGWDTVPSRVIEAAKLLVNDYACGDSIYRDRYLDAVSGPDWQLEFNGGAYTSTGNVRADQLLADYKLRRGWTVV